ncbi:hypothetical protein BBJ28_00002844 [Nothophytophthora sp. Chile5]|nr:hypothetical protein BBJ28_00002844 [Nothophytophthora sp. Chile5]
MMLRLRAVAPRRQPGAVRALSKSALVTLEKHQRVGILRLNDPKRLNPMTSAMGIALEAKVAEINSRADEFSAVVLTGAGRVYARGFGSVSNADSVGMQEYYSRYMSLRSLKVPLVAALNGPAIGAGLCISLFADVRVAAKDAKLGFTSVNTGLHPVCRRSDYRISLRQG